MPSVLSVVTLNIGSASPGALAITVPSGAQGVVVLLRGQFDAFTVSSSFSSSFTITPSGGAAPVVVATAQVSATGSQTITPSYGSYIAEGAAFFVAFVDGIDNTSTATWVRAVAASSSSSQTIASTTTDLVLAMDNWYTGDSGTPGPPPNESGWTSLGTHEYNNIAGRLRSANSPGASTTTATAQTGSGGAYSAMAEISIIATAGGTTHATSGVLTGQGSAIAGSAARTRAHASSGALSGQGSSIVGSAARTRAHSTSGALTGQGSSVAGSAARTREHPSTGALVGGGSNIAGSASRTREHPSSGSLVGQGSSVTGSADRQSAANVHDTSGVLTGSGSALSGSANRIPNHSTSGALVGQGSTVSGTAARFRAFSSSGALTGQGSSIAGSAARVAGPVSHATTGVLVGSGSQINGSAARTGPAVTHDTSGALVGQGSIITGVANEPETLSAGFLWMLRRQREMEEALRNVPEPVAEVIKAEAPRVIEKPKAQARNELRRALEQENLPYRAAYTQALERLVQQLRQEQEDDEEEEAIAEALLYVL